MLINCPLCKYCGEVPGLVDLEGKPLVWHVNCPNCGYNTTGKTDLEHYRTSVRDARMFDTLELPVDMPSMEVINKRIEWARLVMDADDSSRKAGEFEISILENAPTEISKLDQEIRQLISAMQSPLDPVDRDRMNFERQILCWMRAVIQRQNPS